MDTVFPALKKIPGMTEDEAHEVASKLSRSGEVANKVDLAEQGSRLIEKIAAAKHTMIMWVVGVGIVISLAVLLK